MLDVTSSFLYNKDFAKKLLNVCCATHCLEHFFVKLDMFTVCVNALSFSNYEVEHSFEARSEEILQFLRNTNFIVLLYSEPIKTYKLYNYVCTNYVPYKAKM